MMPGSNPRVRARLCARKPMVIRGQWPFHRRMDHAPLRPARGPVSMPCRWKLAYTAVICRRKGHRLAGMRILHGPIQRRAAWRRSKPALAFYLPPDKREPP